MKLSLRLLLLVLIAALPVLAIQVHDLLEQREQRKAQIADQALQLARLTAAQQDEFVEAARFVLNAAALLPEVQARDAAACSARMTEIMAQFPRISGIGAVGPDGVQFCSSRRETAGVNLADRAYVQRAIETKALATSGYIVGQVSGRPRLNFAYPVLNAEKEVRAVVLLAFDLGGLLKFLPSMPLAPDVTISLVDGNGILLARTPPAPEWVGRSVRDSEFAEAMVSRREGIIEARGVDGVSRLNGFAPLLASADLFAVVGLPWRDAFLAADQLFWREVGLTVFAFALAAVVALVSAEFWIRRPVAALGTAVGRMAKGDLSARVEFDRGSSPELRELGRSFNSMAGALEARQSALQDSEDRLRAVVETAADGILTVNDRGILEFVNPEAERLFGYRRDELLGRGVRMLMPEHDGDPGEGHFDRPLRDDGAHLVGIGREVIGRRKDGGTFPMFVSWGAFRLDGRRYLTAIVRDITERRQFEEHQQLLVAEIDHRAKNLLASVQSMILLSMREARSIDAYTKTLIGRIGAMARAHELLSREKWEGARLHDLIRSELESLVGEDSDAVVIVGEDVRLPARPAQTLALALHELTTNAAKYGALSNPGGRVTITCALGRRSSGTLRLDWVESGGPEVRPPERRGFGSTLIHRGIAHALDGEATTDYAREGLRCHIEISMNGARRPVSAPADTR
jgi:PAS domain S-box-containing protein